MSVYEVIEGAVRLGRSCRCLGDDQWQPATSRGGGAGGAARQADDGRWKPTAQFPLLGPPALLAPAFPTGRMARMAITAEHRYPPRSSLPPHLELRL